MGEGEGGRGKEERQGVARALGVVTISLLKLCTEILKFQKEAEDASCWRARHGAQGLPSSCPPHFVSTPPLRIDA